MTLVLAAAASCTDDLTLDLSRVEDPRVLAVAATPAQGAPGATVRLHALWVDQDGERAGGAPQWSLCTARRALAEVGPVADVCIDRRDDAVVDLGFASAIDVEIPGDACRLFGPDPPPAIAGEPQGRPVDPDHTGGYYQPVIVVADDDLAVYGVRLLCGTAGATQAQAAELRTRHRDNTAPRLTTLAIDGDDDDEREPSRVVHVEPGAQIDLRAGWPSCTRTPTCGDAACTLDEVPDACAEDCAAAAGCDGAEWYVQFDPTALEVRESREAIAVAWYATAGQFDTARTGRASDDEARSSDNRWTAPDEPGHATLWIVVRDDRGGASWRTVEIDVG